MSDEFLLKDQVLALIQSDDVVRTAVVAAVRAGKKDFLTNLVETIAAGMRIVYKAMQIIDTVVNFLSFFFS